MVNLKAPAFADRCIVYSLLGAMFFFFAPPGFAAAIEVTADRNPVQSNESFQLLFSTREDPDGDPDFSVLERDFEILGKSQSSHVSMINGEFSTTLTWTLTVMAKRAGDLEIPPVPFGRDRSSPAAVTVTGKDAKTPDAAADADLFMKVEAGSKNPYVQSQVIYTLRLYRRVDIAQASLGEPELADAVIEKLGDDVNYTTRYNGEQFLVTERKYAIFPQKSGLLTILPLELTAQVVVSSQREPRFGGFFGRQATRTRRIVSNAITLEVRPAPSEFTAPHWLPAEQISLEEKWSDGSGHLTVGEPVTRTLSLSAKGLTVGHLPEIGGAPLPSAAGELKRYSDQPLLQEQKNPDGITALREEKTALIPSAAGRYTLPAIEIPWWNVRTERMETARLPERVVEAVYPAGREAPQAAAGTGTSPMQSAAQPQPQQAKPEKTVEQQPVSVFWMGLSLFLGLGWSITLLAWRRQRKKPAEQPQTEEKALREKEALDAVKRACEKNDPAQAREALLAWGRMRWAESAPVGLREVAERCGEAAQAEIRILDQALYGGTDAPWNGQPLWRALRSKARDKEKPKPRRKPQLEGLYRL